MQLRFTEEELMREHDYAAPQVVAGHRIHGGFDAAGNYLCPRTALRQQAIDNWAQALLQRGGQLFEADASLLSGVRTPNTAQQKLLLLEGLGQTFWNSLTITGVIEARGRFLVQAPIPDYQSAVEEDISEMALGHLHRGLMKAHGLDEGGEPERGIGGHDVMWFALRDLAFGETDYPEPVIPANITRPESSEPMPQIGRPHARILAFLMNLLMIEFRAEIGFAATEALLRDPELFSTRQAEAEQAADVVQRIRLDEEVHVTSLRVMLGEARDLHFKTGDGGHVLGAELIDPFWQSLVNWATVEQPQLLADRNREMLSARILEHAEGERILRQFDALADAA
ncbi:MAG: hypothetical protein OEZ06_00085 [Myxococcales bacterium]|nr:hypothetical protein [Myxococcales bacterium]